MKHGFLIAAPASGSGKTTVARGLMALLRRRGYTVQPFKCGPDYIDTKFHERVCGRPSINLDTFMASPEHVRDLFRRYGADADVCIVEGMMGIFDGYDHDRGSSAEIARVLDLPVILVVDARSAAYSMAPLLQGFIGFRKDVRIAGVIFNKVGSARHAGMLQQVCDDLHVRCFGFLPKDAALEQASRYLGLDFTGNSPSDETLLALEQHVTLQGVLDETPGRVDPNPWGSCPQPQASAAPMPRHVVVARNEESFSFLYQETLDAWSDVTFFDPETEVPQLDATDLLYLPGGYPEKHLEALAANADCRRAIRDYAEQGGHVVAECGGMMYLCQKIVTDEGEWPMCGVLPYSISARRAERKLSLGYRRFELGGREFRGHEFHYTQFLGETPKSAAQVFDAAGKPVATPVMQYKNVLASYTHLAPLLSPQGGMRPSGCSSPLVENRRKESSPLGGTGGGPTPSSSSSPLGETGGGPLPLHPIMLAGTGSDVGKSILATALCRIFRQDGYAPAPFKAQNMALNSFATPEGLEIGRAQAVQAEAAGIACHTDMNPLLLKPQSDHTSQVVLGGKPIGSRDAYDFWRRGRSAGTPGTSSAPCPDFRAEVCAAFDRLAARYNPIVMEGAGSISELNLRQTDIVNMPMARHADADVILVGDIDRGGIFASVYGSIALLPPDDRRRIRGIIVNKFRGDMKLFDEGRRMLEEICGVPVLGVVPYFTDIHIEEEDSMALSGKLKALDEASEAGSGRQALNVAVVLLRHISNYTDFDALERDARVHLYYTSNTSDLEQADIIVIPGTKSTLSDLLELRRNGCAQAILRAHRRGATVLGICGGYQMMGIEVCDPDHVEGDVERLPGLDLLPTTTTMSGEKVTRQVETDFGTGYEIHMGVTRPFGDARPSPLLRLADGRTDGYVVSERCMGTYVHGILDNAPFVERLLAPFADKLEAASEPFDYHAYKERQYDLLADHVRRHVDIPRLYEIMGRRALSTESTNP